MAPGSSDSGDALDATALSTQARGLLDTLRAGQIAACGALFAERWAQGRGVMDMAGAACAAVRGAVDSALVDIDGVVPGRMDPDTGATALAAVDEASNDGVVEEIARQITLAGGRVYAVRAADIPGGHPIAAILRYKLD